MFSSTVALERLPLRADVPRLRCLVSQHRASLVLYSERQLLQNYRQLRANLPSVRLFFALKPLPLPEVVRALAADGASFDIASSGELDLLRPLDMPVERIFYSNPVKFPFDIEQVYDYGVRTFVIDNLDELGKLEPYRADCAIMLRVAFPNEEAVVRLSDKFGAPYHAAPELLRQIAARGFRPLGISFHVGSRMRTPYEYVAAIEQCAQLFAHARQQLGLALEVLNIGGGFPDFSCETPFSVADFCAPINAALAKHFAGVAVYAEPGRSIVNSCIDVVTQVIGKAERNGKLWYYLNDGIYSSFSGCLFDGRTATFEVLDTLYERPAHPAVLAGPTCDSIDVMRTDLLLPELEIGDLLLSRNMGAYTIASATSFNLIKKPVFIHVDSQ